MTAGLDADVERLRALLSPPPEVLLVLGSGLSRVAELVEDAVVIPFSDVACFPDRALEGHANRYVHGRLGGRSVLAQCGRFHVYEGFGRDVVAAPVRLAVALGVGALVVTNAAGGIDRRFSAGTYALIDDHINLMGANPLIGPPRAGETRFPDMSAPYDADLQRLALAAAADLHLRLERGVYAAVSGPSYETPAEIEMLRRAGAHLVGMSTVPEVLVARAAGVRCLGFSLVTNRAAGAGREPLSHDDVVEIGASAGRGLGAIVRRTLELMEGPADSADPGMGGGQSVPSTAK